MILVTGISGSLGGLVYRGLSTRDDLTVVAGSRSGDDTATRRIDFDDPAALTAGLRGVDVLVMISAGYAEDDVVLGRHGAVVDAAAAAGVRHVIYTSLAGSGDLMTIALPHRWTEKRLAAAPFEVTILRNGLYAEVPVGLAVAGAAASAESGVFAAPFGTGRISVVAREDLAEVAVRVSAETDRDLAAGQRSRHAGKVYELAGVTAIGGSDIAEILSGSLGRPVNYLPISLTEMRNMLQGSGLEPYQITHTLSLFANLGAGLLESSGTDLPELLPTAPRDVRTLITDVVRAGGYQSVSVGSRR
ncbi:NmrA family NAD(P)-binding protein [Nocardia sp. NPDC004604]|uniref:NmrA family NAD(P)-binding protein n=1 Tax=Nocardia sp. NPDC004604 TaxID=3157013 RepID=UPI0033BAB3CA